jgi:SAM-dependent methyltransferase
MAGLKCDSLPGRRGGMESTFRPAAALIAQYHSTRLTKGALRMQVSPETRSAWTQYWDDGHTESLPEDRAAGLLVAFDSAWREFFSGFPDRARLLDLATGGGDVVRRAIAVGRNFNITGVDLADISAVSAALQVAGIGFTGNTDLSNLPFPDATFDGVTSQFGIEYADVSAATHEAIRVLAPGGRGRFVLHRADSAITQGVARSLAAERSVFADSSAFQSGKTVFELHQRSASPAAIAEAEAEFRRATGVLQSRLRSERAFGPARNVVAFLTSLANAPGLHAPADALRQMDIAERQIQTRTLRKQAQIDAALNRQGVDKVAESLAGAGAVVGSPQELKYPGGRILGWGLLFYK